MFQTATANLPRLHVSFVFIIWEDRRITHRMYADLDTHHVYAFLHQDIHYTPVNSDTSFDICSSIAKLWYLATITNDTSNISCNARCRTTLTHPSTCTSTTACTRSFRTASGEPLMFADFAPGQPAISGRQTLEFKAYDDYRFRWYATTTSTSFGNTICESPYYEWSDMVSWLVNETQFPTHFAVKTPINNSYLIMDEFQQATVLFGLTLQVSHVDCRPMDRWMLNFTHDYVTVARDNARCQLHLSGEATLPPAPLPLNLHAVLQVHLAEFGVGDEVAAVLGGAEHVAEERLRTRRVHHLTRGAQDEVVRQV
jgi:hypothetical protein